ncbi:hypothetical protein E1A91_A02G013100v1 [Gossypium mustelinum]|uniref:Uncharacterized protein n=1 Tax=Gossypium mustelinum TaxID=34275 RepID=A0A5D3A187_GOSMU|nr:hypothetical protein E1A91_A02G013100v1 [Gossypium mustelinum]
MASSVFDTDTDTALRLLLSCAKAIEDGDLKSADAFLHNILILADERPYLYKSRVVKYFADALVRRAYGLHPASSYFTFPVDPSPYYHCGSYLINGVIENVIHDALMEKNALMGNRRLHLIDFSIPYSSFQNSVLRTLPTFSGDPLPVRVSYILPTFLKKYVKFSRQMEILTRDAEEVNVKLEDELKVVYANSLAEADEFEIDFKRREDEMVVVYYKFKLDKMVRDAKAMERELVRLKEINPTIVIMLDFYSNHTHSNFLTCFKDSFQYSLKTLDFWAQLELFLEEEYEWECNIEAWEGNNVIRRHPTLTEWQHLFSMAGFSRIPLNHRKAIDLIDKFDRFVEIMGEEEECLILGYKECPMFFLSAWKPNVEEEHLNFNSSNDKYGLGFNPYPSPLPPVQPFPEGLALNRVAVIAEIHDILNHLHCEHKFSSALTWASRVNNMNETISDPNKYTFSIQSNSCYLKYFKSHLFMHLCEDKIKQTIIEKAIESKDGYHCEPSITNLDGEDNPYSVDVKKYDIDVVVAICLQNRYTNNDLYVVEFYWPAMESETSKSLALRIFNDLTHIEKKFVTVKVEGTEKAISNIPTSSDTATPLKIAEETEDVDAVEINGVNVQRGVVSTLPSQMPTHSSSKVVAAPFNTPEGPHNQIVSYGDPEIGKANKEKVPRTKRRNLRPKTGKGNKEKLPKTIQARLTSAVWKDFVKCLDVVTGKEKSRCTHCSTELTRKKKRGTKHMKNHLIYHCPVMKIQRRLNFVKMIIKHRYPLDMADQKFFKNFVKDMQPMFEFESKDISSYIRSIYKEEKEKLQLYFDKLASKFNLTVSLWKNNSGKTAYCCLIAHFIDDSWELKMKTLGLRTLKDINDTKAVGGIIQSLVSEWNIGSKVCSITVDNSFLDDSMVQQIKENCLSNLVSLSSSHWFINCTLLEDGFREMDDLLFNLKKSIEYVTETKHGRLKFQEAIDQDGKSWDDLSFKLESDFGILDSALRSREIFCKLEQIDVNFKLNPSMEEWENAAALQSCLRCFDDIKGTQSITVSLYFPKLCHIYKKFLELEKSNHSFVTLMKRRFDHYWRLCNSALAVASVLDPRLKFKIVEFSYRVIYGHDSKVQLSTFREVLTNVYNEYANETKNQTTSASVLDDINWHGNNSIWDSFSEFVTASNFNEASSKSELELYLDEPLLPKDGAIFDILGWWCDKSQKFPILAKMARDFLSIPVSIFTPCSNIKATINNPAYNILNPESMETLVCSENWLETPKGNDGENHEPTQTTDKGKRKLDEDTCVRKKSKPSNCEKAISIEVIVKDSNNNGI